MGLYACVLLCPTLCNPPWNIAHWAPLSMRLSRSEYWSELSFASPGDLPSPWIEPVSPVTPALAGRCFTTVPSGKPKVGLWPSYLPDGLCVCVCVWTQSSPTL